MLYNGFRIPWKLFLDVFRHLNHLIPNETSTTPPYNPEPIKENNDDLCNKANEHDKNW